MVEIIQQLPQIEAMCQQLYLTQSGPERTHAERTLLVFSQSPDYIVHCKAILDNSKSPYAQLIASSSLMKVITDFNLSLAMRIEMKNYFLTYLDSHVDVLEGFVLNNLVQLLCRLCKLCWMDDDVFQNIISDVKTLLEKGTSGNSTGLYFLGLKILNNLVAEFNKPIPGRSLGQHRKFAVHFRDNALFGLIELALTALQQLQAGNPPSLDLQKQAMSLALGCLSYDFVGTSLDDSLEDLGTIQVPNSWRRVTEDPATLDLFWSYYLASTPPLSKEALECLVRLASVRRSLFSNEQERTKFLKHLVTGTLKVLRTKHGLSEHENYHEFCRLLGRLKTNYQLSELVNIDGYQEWIKLVAEFTVSSLTSWQWAQTSIYYLLGLWNRLVTSMPYLKGESPSLLAEYVPDIIDAYITSRLESVQLVLQTGADDPLDKEAELHDQMECIPFLCRFQYDQSCPYICNKLDPIMDAYAKWNGQDAAQIQLLEGQLTWLVQIISAIIRGRANTGSSSSSMQEVYDGDLSARLFSLLNVMDQGFHQARHAQKSHQRLDIAVLGFFQSFRKVYVGEHVMKTSSEVYTRLKERLNLTDPLMVLNIILGKIALNLKVFGNSEDVIFQTLSVFEELAIGYMSGKLLLKLDAVSYLLQNHGSKEFAFLDDPTQSRNRTTFYFILARLLFLDESSSKYKAFLSPFQQVFAALYTASNNATDASQLRQSVPKERVIGLCRDLRGVAAAISGRRPYGNFFEWLFPTHLQTLRCCLEAWKEDPEVTNSLLKFVSEMAYNKTQRLSFEASSANGILLFREMSQVVVMYGTYILNAASTGDLYASKYKGIWICFQTLARALGGNYVMYAVFDLYGDPCLKEVLEVTLKMVLSIPLADIMSYSKLGKAYFSLVEVLCSSHTEMLATRDTATFSFLLLSLDAGLKALDHSVSTMSATAIDNLAGYYFKAVNSEEAPTAAAQAIAEHLQKQPELFPGLLNTLFEITLFQECANQWSLSRPMLTLILVNEQIYPQMQERIIQSRPASRQSTLRACLSKLMDDVQRNLDPKNRDKFTQAGVQNESLVVTVNFEDPRLQPLRELQHLLREH